MLLRHPELQSTTEKLPVFSERELLLASIPFSKNMKTEFPSASKKAPETKEAIRKRLATQLGQLIVIAGLPAAGLLTSSTAPDRLMGRFAAGRRASTLAQKINGFKSMQSYMEALFSKAFPTEAFELLDWICERAAEPCGPTVPGTILAMTAFFEDVGGRPEVARLSSFSTVRAVVNDLALELSSGKPRMKKKARQYLTCIINSWENTVCDKLLIDWERTHAWTELVKFWAAHRTNDQAGIKALSVVMNEHGLKGIISMTKTTGPGKTVPALEFTVSFDAWFLRSEWLQEGYDLFDKHRTDRPFLLPLLALDKASFSDREPSFQQSITSTRVLISRATAFEWQTDEEGWTHLEVLKKPLLVPGAQCFWQGHSARATLPTMAAAIGVEKDRIDPLGRWLPQASEEYVRVSAEIVRGVQKQVAEAYRSSKGRDIFFENGLIAELGNFCISRAVPQRLVDEMLTGIRKCTKEPFIADMEVAEVPEVPDSLGGLLGPFTAELPDDELPSFEKGLWVVSQARAGKTQTLHRTGSCWRLPGVHYQRFNFLSDLQIEEAKVGDVLYSSVCRDCFPRGLNQEEATDSSSSDDTTDSD